MIVAFVAIAFALLLLFHLPYAVAQTLAPQIPLIDAPYPNENQSSPLVINVTNAAHQFMAHAYRAQLAGDTQGYTLNVYLHNAIVCYHGLINNNTLLMSGCDDTMVQVKLLNNQYSSVTPHWFVALVDQYLKARGITE